MFIGERWCLLKTAFILGCIEEQSTTVQQCSVGLFPIIVNTSCFVSVHFLATGLAVIYNRLGFAEHRLDVQHLE